MLTYRSTHKTDASALAALLETVWKGEESGASYHGSGLREGVVACTGEMIVGYGHLWHSRLHPTYAYVGVHVLPGWRGQGIGRQLWDAVTRNTEKPLKAKTYATQTGAVGFLQRRGLRVSVETYEPTLTLADLGDVSPSVEAAEQLGYRCRPMTELPGELLSQLLPLHREVYAQSHLHDPARAELMDEEDVLGDDLCPAWLFVAEDGGQLAGVASVRRTDEPTVGELGWFGVPRRFADVGVPLTLGLTALAVQAAHRDGVQVLRAELDSADPNASHLYGAFPWSRDRVWLTFTSR